MKKLFLVCLVAALTIGSVNAQEQKNEKTAPEHGPKIVFAEQVHNYGTIQKGADGNCTFTFTNMGDEPLIISNVRASCGCTTPKYTQKPVMPGKTGEIGVRYNTNNVGGFTKTVTITSNAINEPRVVVKIKGNVVAPDKQ
jgi:hypothetical protein